LECRHTSLFCPFDFSLKWSLLAWRWPSTSASSQPHRKATNQELLTLQRFTEKENRKTATIKHPQVGSIVC
jgi:hypothetical protein